MTIYWNEQVKIMQDKKLTIPKHVAIIMDGNGRWARKRMMPRNYGHNRGSKVVEKICEDAYNIGIKYLTVYAFSTENWNRPKGEVDELMKLLRTYLESSIKESKKNNMRVRVIGAKTRLDDDIIKSIEDLEEASKDNTGLNLTIALNYGARDEIIRAINLLSKDLLEKNLSLEQIDERRFEKYLDTKDIPDPDLLIRTSGEMRLSNFLLWQMAYTEFYFTDVLWPDFNKKELMKAIEYYNTRVRKFGTVV